MSDIFSPIKTKPEAQKYPDFFSAPDNSQNETRTRLESQMKNAAPIIDSSTTQEADHEQPATAQTRPDSELVRFAQDRAAYRAEQIEKYQVDLSDEEYAVLKDRIADSDDPDAEAYKWATAMEYTRMYDIPVSEAYTNLEILNEKTFGKNVTFTPKTNMKAVVDSLALGASVVRRGALGLNIMQAESTNNQDELERYQKELAELDEKDATLQDAIPRPWYIDVLKAGAQAAPFSAYTASAALVGGLFAPAAATAAAFATSMATAQGLQYNDLRKSGVQPELAKNLSAGSAALQSVVELGLGNSAEFVAKVGGVNTITANLFKRMYATKAWTRALKVIGNYGAELLGEASEEAIQSLIGDGTQALAAVLQDGGVDPISATEAAQKAWESAKGGFMGAILLGVPNLAINAGVEYSDAKKLKKTAETVQSKEAFIAETADSPVFEGMTEEARKDAQEKVWESAAGTREQIIAKEAQDIAELTDTATDEELVEGVDEGIPVNRGNPVRLETGRIYVQEGGSVVANDDGSVTRTLKAGDPTRETSNNRYGYIKFREYDDRVVIEDLRTKSGYDGIRQDFFLEFAERVAGKDIQWDPAGKRAQALKETLISRNPRGVKAGLQYFASDMDAGTIRGRLKLESRIAEYLPKLDSSERAAAVALLEARASTKGIDLETYLETTFQGEGFSNAVNVIPDAAQAAGVQTGAVKGGVSFAKDVSGAVRALIYVTEKSDFSTYVHEMAHVFRQEMESTIQAEAEAAFGVKDGKWSRDDEERFAVGFEEYLREGKAPSEQLKNLFQKMAEFLYRIYNALANRVEVSPEIRAVYDQLLSGDTPLAETAKKLASQSTRPTAQATAPATTQNTTKGAESRDISLDDNKARIVDQSPEIKTSAKETEGPEPTFQDKTQDALDEAGELYKTIPEDLFFQSAAVKKLLEQMTREELIELLHSSDSAAGLPNYRAYRRDIEQDGKWPVQVSLDADSLKWVNDNMGHSSGDFMLREIGEAIKHEAAGSGIRVYHKSGDEFLAQAHTVNEYMKFKIALDKRLNSVIIKSQDKELGVTIEKPGIFLSDGIDNKGDMDAADKNLEPEKSYREAHGERSGRGKVPPGVRVVYDTGRSLDDSETKLFFENRAEELKAQKELNKNPTNQFTPERTRELRKIIEDGGDILFQTEDNEESGTRDLRSYFPKVRGGWTKDKILKQLKQWGAKTKGTYLEEAYALIKELISSERLTKNAAGHLYQVDIPEADDYLDWDKPFNQQNEKIQKILIDYSREADSYFKEILAPFERNSTTGGVVYRALEKAFRSSEEASKRLLLLGIPGIKFSNGSTRNTSEKQQHNFVIFDDKDVSITEMLFQTEEELVKDAASFESWQEFMEYYEEGACTRPEEAAVPENADAQWYQTVWEKAKGIIPEESLSEAEVQEQIEQDNRTPGSPQTMDALWLVEMKKPGKLEEFLKRINWILTQKNEFGPEDSSELESMENIERLKRRITTELRHGSWISNATRLGVGRNLTERARRTLITLMSHASRDYRALYADIMQDPEWEVALADTEAGKLASIADPEIDYTELTPEQRRKIAERIDNAALAQKLKTGELTLEEAERHITYLNSQLAENNQKIKALEKEEESFRAEVGADYRSISDWETRRLLETADDLQMARAAYESRSDKTSRMIERGLAITEKYRKESQQIKANYDSIFRKFSDLSRAMEISGAVRTAIARRESLFEARAENERLKGQIAANREARKIRTQLVKKTMRKIRWNTIDYEYGRKILAIQRKFSPALFKGLNRWIGTEGPYLREMYSRWKTDNAYRVQLDIKMGKKHGWGKAQKLLDKPYDSWTNKEREFMLSVLPKEDWIEELNLDALAKDREEALQMDEESKEFADLVASALPARIISRIEKRLFAEWTIEEMEELAAVIDDLYSSGKRQLQAKRDAVRFDSDLTRAKIQRALAGVSSDDSPAERDRKIAQFRELYGYSQHIKGSSADALSRGTFKARIMNKGFLDANVRRVARFLDGGKDGINTELLYNQEDVVFNIEHRKIRERQKRIAESMEKYGITLPELYEMKTFSDLMGDGKEKSLSVDELLFILKADLDDQSRRAVMFGNFLEDTEKDFTSDEKLLTGLAEPRYNTVLSIAQNLPDKFLRFADEIAADYSDQYERMNEASIAEFNKPVWRVQNYVPLLRLESGGDKNENRVAEDLFALSSGRKQSGADKGMTEKRVDIPATWQRPVQLGLYSTWVDSVKRTEHFIAYAPYIRELNRVYKSNDASNLRGWMKNRYGDGILKYIDGYINELANPDALGEQTKIDRLVKAMRGKTAPAYLAWKTSGILKQFITSPAPYFAHVNPAEYAAAAFDLALHPQLISETIREKSVFMDSRVMDPIMDLIKEQQLKSSNKAAAAWNEFSTLGMKGLEFADWACVAPGWLAVYRKELAKLEKDNVGVVEREISRLQEENDKAALELQKTDAEIRSLAEKKVLSAEEIERRSVKAADDATRLCQPSSRLSDLAPLFKIRGANTEVWKMLTQFQTSLNVIWQNIRYDLPNAVREKQWEQVVGMVSGYVVAGMAVNLFTQGLSEGDDDDDTEKVKQLVYYATTQFTDAVPLVGDLVTAQTKKMITGSSGYYGSDDFYPALSKLFQGVAAVTDGDWQRSALRFTEGVGYVFGAPVSGAKEAGRVLGIGDGDGELNLNPEALAGRR